MTVHKMYGWKYERKHNHKQKGWASWKDNYTKEYLVKQHTETIRLCWEWNENAVWKGVGQMWVKHRKWWERNQKGTSVCVMYVSVGRLDSHAGPWCQKTPKTRTEDMSDTRTQWQGCTHHTYQTSQTGIQSEKEDGPTTLRTPLADTSVPQE